MDFVLAPITIHQIIVFLKVVEYNGFAKASGYLHMTQSAVSKSIARLEKELGIELFHRTTREIKLTEAGRSLYNDWQIQIGHMHESYLRAASLQKKDHSILRVGLVNTVRPETYFWKLEESLKKEHPDISLDLETEYITSLVEKLFTGEYDAVMLPDFERFALENKGLSWKWAACSNANILLSTKHSLAQKKSVTMLDILYEDFASLNHGDKGSHFYDLEERFSTYHVKPNIVSSYKTAYDIKYLFRTESSVLIFVDSYFDFPDTPGITRIPVIDQKNGIICAWNPNNNKKQLQNFIKLLKPDTEDIPKRT